MLIKGTRRKYEDNMKDGEDQKRTNIKVSIGNFLEEEEEEEKGKEMIRSTSVMMSVELKGRENGKKRDQS